MNKLIDKLIILLLISSIPLGIYMSSKFDNKANQKIDNVEKAKLEKIDQVINNLNEIKKKPKPTPVVKTKDPEIKISLAEKTAKYELTIKGKAPKPNFYIMATEIITYQKPTPTPKPKTATKSAKPTPKPKHNQPNPKDTIKAQAIKPDKNGNFILKLPTSENMNLIQIKFEQDEVSKTIQFSIPENKLIQ